MRYKRKSPPAPPQRFLSLLLVDAVYVYSLSSLSVVPHLRFFLFIIIVPVCLVRRADQRKTFTIVGHRSYRVPVIDVQLNPLQ